MRKLSHRETSELFGVSQLEGGSAELNLTGFRVHTLNLGDGLLSCKAQFGGGEGDRVDGSPLGAELNLTVHLMSFSFKRLSEQSECIVFVHLF